MMETNELGRVADGDQALVNQAAAHLGPSGFDPSREIERALPYLSVSQPKVRRGGWMPIQSAPRDGTWFQSRGRDWGNPEFRYHYQDAKWGKQRAGEKDRFVGRDHAQLVYLTCWRPIPASGIEARSDETPSAAQPEGQEPDPKGDAQGLSA